MTVVNGARDCYCQEGTLLRIKPTCGVGGGARLQTPLRRDDGGHEGTGFQTRRAGGDGGAQLPGRLDIYTHTHTYTHTHKILRNVRDVQFLR